MIGGCFAENDLQLKTSCGSSPPYIGVKLYAYVTHSHVCVTKDAVFANDCYGGSARAF